MAKKPKKVKETKYVDIDMIQPDEYVAPKPKVEPSQGQLNQQRNDIKSAIRAILADPQHKGMIPYGQVIKMLGKDPAVVLTNLRHELEFLISEVDKERNPEKFVEPAE